MVKIIAWSNKSRKRMRTIPKIIHHSFIQIVWYFGNLICLIAFLTRCLLDESPSYIFKLILIDMAVLAVFFEYMTLYRKIFKPIKLIYRSNSIRD